MKTDGFRELRLTEYKPLRLARGELTDPEAESIWRAGGNRIRVEAPKPWSGNCWELVSEGWVGYIPAGRSLGLVLEPKLPLANLFRMLEYAYKLESFQLLHGDMEASSLKDFYERLANVLAKRVLDRTRKGLYASYLVHVEQLPFVRGTLDLRERLKRPWATRIACRYQEHTADLEDNQILTWTLGRIAQSGLCSDRVLPVVRRAFHSLHGAARNLPFSPRDCAGRLYNRLNCDYEPLHALCRFFLEHAGPTHEVGDRKMIPFVVNMARLYELFVAEWLKQHLPPGLELKYQETFKFGADDAFAFAMDMVLYDTRTGRPLSVLDAKYKVPDKPGAEDIAQVLAYAGAKGCAEAALVYPRQPDRPLDAVVGGKRVRSLVFGLSDDLHLAGSAFLDSLSRLVAEAGASHTARADRDPSQGI